MDSRRRRLLTIAASAVPVQWVAGCAKVRDSADVAGSAADATPARLFFTESEWRCIDAAVSRLIPADDLGPGAREAAVTVFIDHQLAGPYGRAETWYLQGPWPEGTDEQGYQLKLTPAQLYRTAIRELDAYCASTQQSKRFSDLAAGAQDKVLAGLESGEVELASAPAKTWFEMLLQNTVEGFLADPMYGGNRDFIGWNMIGFPGPRYDYVAEIEQYNRRYALPPVGILGRDGRKLAAES